MKQVSTDSDIAPLFGVPISLTGFVGRRRELGAVTTLLATHRLVTLAGAGGSGKSPLAAEVARTYGSAAGSVVAWVEVAHLGSGQLVAGRVAHVLGVREEPGVAAEDALVAAIGARALLLVLDSCEHVVDACAALAERLLHGCPGLRVVATSRQSLGVAGEKTWLVPPLALPGADEAGRDAAAGSEAVQLFVQRAADATTTFALTDANADTVVRICRRLDGLPLAIELAAARIRLLPPEQLVRRLDDVFGLLTAGPRTTLPRHRTLRALIDWSYDLLSPDERVLFVRLAVFAGGFTLDAAEAVTCCGALERGDVLDLLAALVDKSLVSMREQGGEARYTLLETVRQYADARLHAGVADETGAASVASLRQRHARHFLALAEELGDGAARQPLGLGRLDAEHDNLRAALSWSLASGAAALALRLCVALRDFWRIRGHLGDARRWTEDALALTDAGAPGELDPPAGTSLRARALAAAGALARLQGEHDDARAFQERAVALARACEDGVALADALTSLGSERVLERRLAEAAVLLEEAVALWRTAGDARGLARALAASASVAAAANDIARSEALLRDAADVSRSAGDREGEARALTGLGELARQQRDFARARAFNERGVALYRAVGDRWHEAVVLHNLGWVASASCDWDAALADFADSVDAFTAIGARTGAASCLAGVAVVQHARGEAELAARALATAWRQFQRVGASPAPADAREWERARKRMLGALGADAFERAWADPFIGDIAHVVADVLIAAGHTRHARAAAAGPPAIHAAGASPMTVARDAGTHPGPVSPPAANAHTRNAAPPAVAVARPAAETKEDAARVYVPDATAEPAAGADLRVLALGPLRIARGDAPLPPEAWGSSKPRELLLYLLSHGGRTRDQVGLVFWPDATPAQVTNSFHVTLYRLRKALGRTDWITIVDDRYRLAPDLHVEFDAATFEREIEAALREARRGGVPGRDRLEAALALYRGDFLEDEVFGNWSVELRERLQRLHREGLLLLGGMHFDEGRFGEAADAFRAVIARDDLHEEAYRRLMRTLAAAGARTEALRLFRRLEALLRDELGVTPEAETLAVHARLQQAIPS